MMNIISNKISNMRTFKLNFAMIVLILLYFVNLLCIRLFIKLVCYVISMNKSLDNTIQYNLPHLQTINIAQNK